MKIDNLGDLIPHTHRDHFDLPTLERLGITIRVVLPRGEANRLIKRGFKDVQEFSPEKPIQVGALTVRATYAEHGYRRFALLREINCLGYPVSGKSHGLFRWRYRSLS